jgi:hypothetical protein
MTNGYHALTDFYTGQRLDKPLVLTPEREGPIYCHPRDQRNIVTPNHLVKAAELFETLSTVPRKNDVWPALRWPPIRPTTDTRCSGKGLNPYSATMQELCDKVKACYRVRSELIHGRWEDDPGFDEHMYNTEAIARTVIRHIASKPGMLAIFLSLRRDEFLEAWVESKAFTPPELS